MSATTDLADIAARAAAQFIADYRRGLTDLLAERFSPDNRLANDPVND